MKRRVGILALLLVALLASMLVACAPKAYTAKPNEEIYGTWINLKAAEQKFLYLPDGTWKQFAYTSDTVPVGSGTYKLVRKWKDAEGNTWYQENLSVLVGVYKFNAQQLDKIDKTGKTLESIFQEVGQFDNKSYPKQLDPKSESYSIGYRSE